jgi:hypothetical protein
VLKRKKKNRLREAEKRELLFFMGDINVLSITVATQKFKKLLKNLL